MHELAPLIYDLTIMLGIAAIVIIIFQRIHQPIVLGYLVAGIILGPHTPPYGLVSQSADIATLSELGVIFLMFSLGLEFSFHKLVRVGFSASVTGLLEVVFMMILGFAVGRLMGWTYYDSVFLGAALSISSTTIIIKAIDELKLKSKRFAELIFGVLVVEDLLAILLLVGLSTLVATNDVFSWNMLLAVFKLIVVVGSWFLVGYFVVPSLFRHIGKYLNEETLTIVSVALCLFLVVVAARYHYSAALGAFIMGSILAETMLIHRIETLIRPIRDIFAAVFFISVGMMIDPKIIMEQWQVVLLISLVTVVGKVILTSISAFLTGQSVTTSVRVGFSMAQIGEFSFIIAGLGVALNVTNSTLYPIIVAVSGVTTFTTPYLIRFSGFVSEKIEKHLPKKTKRFLSGYSAWVFRATASSHQQPWFRKVSIKLFINALIVAVIFTLTDQFIFPRLGMLVTTWPANVISLCIALILASPFIWGMLFSYKSIGLPDYGIAGVNPAIFIIWLLTFTELSFLSIVYFETWFTLFAFFFLVVGFFAVGYRYLEKYYKWFERGLVSNIKMQPQENERYEALAPWDSHLVEIDVGEHSAIIGKTLSECDFRQQVGVNVVAIAHGARVMEAPRGDEVIAPLDKLIVLGTDEQIEALRKEIESVVVNPPHTDFLANLVLEPIVIGKGNTLIGKTIRDSKIREKVNGMVVGMERADKRILNPDPELTLKENDLLFVVGDSTKMHTLY